MSSVSQRIRIDMASGDSASAWVQINAVHNGGIERGYTYTMDTSDTINIELSNSKDPNTVVNSFIQSDAITGAANGGGFIEGAFEWLRVIKTGTNGAVVFEILV